MAGSASNAVENNDTKHASDNETSKNEQRPYTPMAGSSDGEDERSARERLKKTSIAGLAQQSKESPHSMSDLSPTQIGGAETTTDTQNGSRGRPAKKRSFEDLARDDVATGAETTVGQPPSPKSGHHKRMRSRDVASTDQPTYGTLNDIAGTVHEESDLEAHKSPGGPGVLVDVPSQEEMDAEAQDKPDQDTAIIGQEDDKERSQTGEDSSKQSVSQVPATSGFSNTSTTSAFANISSASPFGSTQPKSPIETSTEGSKSTSNSAFASSGLSAFASSEKSPFGAAGSSQGGFSDGSSGFGSTTGSAFGGSSGFGSKPTGFGGSTGGFGSVASPFGAPRPFGSSSAFGGGSGFGGGSKPGSFGKAKPFGSSAKNEEDEGSEKEDDGNENISADTDTQQDPRFHEQHVDTGEEKEQTYFTCRAKLYHFEKEWKEKGVGTLKLNIRIMEEQTTIETTQTSSSDRKAEKTDEEDPEAGLINFNKNRKGRLLMRADGVHRVILNTPIFRGMRFGAPDGSEPSGKTMHLQGLEDGKPRGYQIKIGKEEVLKDLYHKIHELEKRAI